MALNELEKGILSLLRLITPVDIKKGGASEGVSNALACCLALLSEVSNSDFLLVELEQPLQKIRIVLTARTVSLSELDQVVEDLEDYDSKTAAERNGGPLVEFLVQHPVGISLFANAQTVSATRGRKKGMQVEVDQISKQSQAIRSETVVEPSLPTQLLDAVATFEQAVDQAEQKKGDRKHRLTTEQKHKLTSEHGEVWEHMLRVVKELIGTSLCRVRTCAASQE